MLMNEDINTRDMNIAALRVVDVLRGLPTALLLLMCQLSLGEANVAGLEAAVGITQPTLSQQLGNAPPEAGRDPTGR
jgi:DNA-binding HxlR family transcriptional regulator